MTTTWSNRYARRTRSMQSSAIREILKITQQPDVISFAGGLPAPELFPVAEVQRACARVLQDYGRQALQYTITEGYPPLRQYIVEKMARYGIPADIDNVLITNGSQQALDLVGKVLLDEGDPVVVEAPTYLGALQAWQPYGPRFVSVPSDDDGMRVDRLEAILKRYRPKLIYILPNFQNPAGTTLSRERREHLVRLANDCGVPLIEDDPYGELRYEGEHLPPVIALDCQKLIAEGKASRNGFFKGNVIYLSTFSKTLAPGLRLGWVIGPVEVVQKLVQAKQGADLHTGTFTQMVAYEVIRGNFLDNHVRRIRAVYRQRRDAMLAAMEQYFPPGVTWTQPQGGLFLWVRLPEGLDTESMLHDAVAQKVAFVPGRSFFADGDVYNTMRLNFSNTEPARIVEGIGRLAKVIKENLEPAGSAAR